MYAFSQDSSTDPNFALPGWCFLVTPLYCMPAYLPTTATTMNYASVVFVAGVAVSAMWYLVWGRKNYKGPPVSEEEVIAHRVSIIGA